MVGGGGWGCGFGWWVDWGGGAGCVYVVAEFGGVGGRVPDEELFVVGAGKGVVSYVCMVLREIGECE